MYQKFLTARSPVRVLEKGLHGGLGKGNLGLVLAGPRRRQDARSWWASRSTS